MHIATPLIHSEKLSKHAKRPVYLKLENLQPTGSFKIRGIGHLVKKVESDVYKINLNVK